MTPRARRSGPPRTLADVVCRTCGVSFRPRQKRDKGYCSSKCYSDSRRLEAKPCLRCGVKFQPVRSINKYCGLKCSTRTTAAVKRLDWPAILALSAGGVGAKTIAEQLGCSAVSVWKIIRKHRTTNTESGT